MRFDVLLDLRAERRVPSLTLKTLMTIDVSLIVVIVVDR
jgi:hypothetical protein